jgi:hypothetical protein
MAVHEVPIHQASGLMGVSIPAERFASDEGIALVLTPERLDMLWQRLAINSEWLIRGEGKPQSPSSIKRNSYCWIDELGEAKLSDHASIRVCRSEPVELKTNYGRQGPLSCFGELALVAKTQFMPVCHVCRFKTGMFHINAKWRRDSSWHATPQKLA